MSDGRRPIRRATRVPGGSRAGLAERLGAGGRSRGDWLVDSALFVGSATLGAFTLAYLWHDHGVAFDALDVAAGVVACLALWARRSHPTTTFAIAFATASFSPLALFAGLVAMFNAAMRARGAKLVACALGAAAGSAIFPLVNPKAQEVFRPSLPAFFATVIAFAAGLVVRYRIELVASWRERAERLEADRERGIEEARDHERRRIAREMHDVLAHRLSLLSIHAGALEFRPDAPSEEVARAASVIRASAASALDELRQVITVLREDTTSARNAPQPNLGDLPDLLDESRAAGMRINAQVEVPETLPETLGRTAYRVVQEGLTNARKHAPGAEVNLSVTGSDHCLLVVEVTNGRSRAPGPADPTSIGGTRAGLIGLAERLALIGGTLEHGTNASGDYVLRATVPRS
jgi:signal transduction histidine kinase